MGMKDLNIGTGGNRINVKCLASTEAIISKNEKKLSMLLRHYTEYHHKQAFKSHLKKTNTCRIFSKRTRKKKFKQHMKEYRK